MERHLLFSEGGWSGMSVDGTAYAASFSAKYGVSIYDRRNCGASDIAFDDSPGEFHSCADDLHYLLNTLNLVPAYVSGISGGSVISFQFRPSRNYLSGDLLPAPCS